MTGEIIISWNLYKILYVPAHRIFSSKEVFHGIRSLLIEVSAYSKFDFHPKSSALAEIRYFDKVFVLRTDCVTEWIGKDPSQMPKFDVDVEW